MSTQRTPPKVLNAVSLTQESDTASDYLGSDTGCGDQLNVTRRHKRKHGDNAICEIRDMIADLQLQHANHALKFDEEIKRMIQQNNEIKQSIQYMSDKYDDILCQLQQTKSENTVFKEQIKSLEHKVELLERNSKASCVELRNVPETKPESKTTLTSMVKNIGCVLDIELQDTDIRNIYRPKLSPNKSAPIIVEFSSTSLKENIIRASKTFNKGNKEKLNTTHLKLNGDPKPIFISESLTTYGRRLYYLCREYVKSHRYASCWSSYGKVYLRPKEGEPPKLITREEDLIKLKAL